MPVQSKTSQGIEQGDATGTNSLVGESYSGPTNLNNEEEEEIPINNIICTHVEGTKENPIHWPAQSQFLTIAAHLLWDV